MLHRSNLQFPRCGAPRKTRNCKPTSTAPSWSTYNGAGRKLPWDGGTRPPCSTAFWCALDVVHRLNRYDSGGKKNWVWPSDQCLNGSEPCLKQSEPCLNQSEPTLNQFEFNNCIASRDICQSESSEAYEIHGCTVYQSIRGKNEKVGSSTFLLLLVILPTGLAWNPRLILSEGWSKTSWLSLGPTKSEDYDLYNFNLGG